MSTDVKKLEEEIKSLKKEDQRKQKVIDSILDRLNKIEGGVNLDQEFFTYKEVAKMAGKSERTIRLHEKKTWLKAKFPKRKKRFYREDVVKYLRGRC